jgi:hypothetical protein
LKLPKHPPLETAECVQLLPKSDSLIPDLGNAAATSNGFAIIYFVEPQTDRS